MIERPAAPAFDLDVGHFEPAFELEAWARLTFMDEGGALYNEEHSHLADARVAFLWTNVGNSRRGRSIVGMAELGQPQGAMGKWNRARAELQVRQWLGEIPDFLITIDAVWWAQSANDRQACALVEHELYHCAQEKDVYGMPKFTRDGQPKFGIRGHDVEEFVGVVRRYGVTSEALREMAEYITEGPGLDDFNIRAACGNCGQP